MAYHVGYILGAALGLFVVLAIVLAIGKIKRLRKHPLAMHLSALVLVWTLGVAAQAPAGAYLVTLVAVWGYRRELKKPPSGWYRLGAGITVIWLVLGMFLLNGAYSGEQTDAQTVLLVTWIFVVLGLTPWLLGWLVQWIREGFKAKAPAASEN